MYQHERELKQAAGFDTPDDAYLLVVGSGGKIEWSYHGPVTNPAMEGLAGASKAGQ